ncbi:ribonuclease H-like domain-containing protein [Tanacetum coccineum]
MFESRRTTIPFPSRLNDYYCDEKKASYGPQFLEANSYEASHIDNSIPRNEKDPRSFTLPCYINNVCFDNALADLGASICVMPLSTYLNLGLGELAHTKLIVELVDRTVKYPKGIAENVLVGIEARLMGETLVLNRSLDPLYRDYIELNDLNVPLELRRDQVDDLMHTIEEEMVGRTLKICVHVWWFVVVSMCGEVRVIEDLYCYDFENGRAKEVIYMAYYRGQWALHTEGVMHQLL